MHPWLGHAQNLLPIYWLCLVAYGIIILPQPGTWPMPPAIEAWNHNRLDSREVACFLLVILSSCHQSPDSPASLLSSLSFSYSPLTFLSVLAPSNKRFETWPPLIWALLCCSQFSDRPDQGCCHPPKLWEDAGRWSEGRASSPVRDGQVDRKGPQTGLTYWIWTWILASQSTHASYYGVYRNTLWSLGVSETNQTGPGLVRTNQTNPDWARLSWNHQIESNSN